MSSLFRPKRAGDQSIPAQEYNDLDTRIKRLEGELFGGAQAGTVPANAVAFKIATIQGDYLTCNRFQRGSVQMTTNVFVAKPYLLRQSLTAWNGLTFTYTDSQNKTASDGSNPDEDWTVIPEYVSGDIIYCARVGNGTGLLAGSVGIRWVDLNVEGRAWAQVPAP